MAALAKWHPAVALAAIALAASALAGCGDLQGLTPTDLPPLVTIHVRATGDLGAVRKPSDEPPRLRATVTWGQAALPDPSCLPPIENPDHAAVVAAGCNDLLAFKRGGFDIRTDFPVAADGTATIDLYSLPDFLYGDRYSQIAYGSVVIYDDVNGNSYLDPFGFQDVVYGASFPSMAKPDTRIAFRHGEFDDRSAYYPRRGCEPPVEGYSVVSAGGFTLQDAIDAQARGELPAQDPAQCRQNPIDQELTVALRDPDELDEVGCFSFAYYFSSPPQEMFPTTSEVRMACTSIPDRGTGRAHGRWQLLMTISAPRGLAFGCRSIQHMVLRGCQDDPLCVVPDWDVPAPDWWPCPADNAQSNAQEGAP
jgi:hypothetical protein